MIYHDPLKIQKRAYLLNHNKVMLQFQIVLENKKMKIKVKNLLK